MTQAQSQADQDAFEVSHRLLLVAQLVQDAHAALRSGLATADGCWGGSDEIAAWSAHGYAPACDSVLNGAEQVSAALSGLCDRAGRIAAGAVTRTEDDRWPSS
ncbi:hypothetical protein [Catellatospora sp. NPDC049133]|uniref:hypothetical protein n=1 Tax=Catellatospora sp. NPDC049133 TaxID=3155499 RepID=UPI00340E0F11